MERKRGDRFCGRSKEVDDLKVDEKFRVESIVVSKGRVRRTRKTEFDDVDDIITKNVKLKIH